MITKNLVAQGLMSDVIRLDIDPKMGSSIVARIGENWFYFGGMTAEEYNDVEQYREDIPFGTIVDEIYDVLHEFQTGGHEEFLDEAAYYESVLSSKVPKSQNRQIQAFMDYLRKYYSFDAVTQRLIETATRFAMRQGSAEEEAQVARTLLEPLGLDESEYAMFAEE